LSTKERPVLFSGAMVNAILEDRKSQTRRAIKPQPPSMIGTVETGLDSNNMSIHIMQGWHSGEWRSQCPFGDEGARLWVRETFCELRPGDEFNPRRPIGERWIDHKKRPQVNGIAYRADSDGAESERCRIELGYKWKPSIFLPRWASRLTLEITSVRVERVQSISTDDVWAEGVQVPVSADGRRLLQVSGKFAPCNYMAEGTIERGTLKLTNEADYVRAHYAALWESINGLGSWAENPWVWVVSFKRIESK